MTLAAIRQLVANSVTAALEAQVANMVHEELLDLSAGLSVLNHYFPVATVPKTARFQELATLCPTMVSNSEKMMEAFIEGLPRSIEGNVTASKP
nr:reverse transcriptase domain-containing protein [Tanacetum cinerariifolium]